MAPDYIKLNPNTENRAIRLRRFLCSGAKN